MEIINIADQINNIPLKEEWSKPEVQILAVNNGTLGGIGTGSDGLAQTLVS